MLAVIGVVINAAVAGVAKRHTCGVTATLAVEPALTIEGETKTSVLLGKVAAGRQVMFCGPYSTEPLL